MYQYNEKICDHLSSRNIISNLITLWQCIKEVVVVVVIVAYSLLTLFPPNHKTKLLIDKCVLCVLCV